jgi:hypothetical protein
LRLTWKKIILLNVYLGNINGSEIVRNNPYSFTTIRITCHSSPLTQTSLSESSSQSSAEVLSTENVAELSVDLPQSRLVVPQIKSKKKVSELETLALSSNPLDFKIFLDKISDIQRRSVLNVSELKTILNKMLLNHSSRFQDFKIRFPFLRDSIMQESGTDRLKELWPDPKPVTTVPNPRKVDQKAPKTVPLKEEVVVKTHAERAKEFIEGNNRELETLIQLPSGTRVVILRQLLRSSKVDDISLCEKFLTRLDSASSERSLLKEIFLEWSKTKPAYLLAFATKYPQLKEVLYCQQGIDTLKEFLKNVWPEESSEEIVEVPSEVVEKVVKKEESLEDWMPRLLIPAQRHDAAKAVLHYEKGFFKVLEFLSSSKEPLDIKYRILDKFWMLTEESMKKSEDATAQYNIVLLCMNPTPYILKRIELLPERLRAMILGALIIQDKILEDVLQALSKNLVVEQFPWEEFDRDQHIVLCNALAEFSTNPQVSVFYGRLYAELLKNLFVIEMFKFDDLISKDYQEMKKIFPSLFENSEQFLLKSDKACGLDLLKAIISKRFLFAKSRNDAKIPAAASSKPPKIVNQITYQKEECGKVTIQVEKVPRVSREDPLKCTNDDEDFTAGYFRRYHMQVQLGVAFKVSISHLEGRITSLEAELMAAMLSGIFAHDILGKQVSQLLTIGILWDTNFTMEYKINKAAIFSVCKSLTHQQILGDLSLLNEPQDWVETEEMRWKMIVFMVDSILNSLSSYKKISEKILEGSLNLDSPETQAESKVPNRNVVSTSLHTRTYLKVSFFPEVYVENVTDYVAPQVLFKDGLLHIFLEDSLTSKNGKVIVFNLKEDQKTEVTDHFVQTLNVFLNDPTECMTTPEEYDSAEQDFMAHSIKNIIVEVRGQMRKNNIDN